MLSACLECRTSDTLEPPEHTLKIILQKILELTALRTSNTFENTLE